jgi:outer membrane protein TolC
VFANTELGRIGTSWPPEDNEWSIGLSLSWPLFEGRRRVGEVSRTKGVLGQAEADERSGRDGVILTMQETWTLLQDARDFVIVQGKQLQAAEERAKISRAQYTAGLIIFDDWTIIEDALVKARKAYLDALAAAAVAEAGWVQAQGWTLEDEPR